MQIIRLSELYGEIVSKTQYISQIFIAPLWLISTRQSQRTSIEENPVKKKENINNRSDELNYDYVKNTSN
jgi:hypothetical protein